MPSAPERLQRQIRRRETPVVVLGLGYVGLPLAVAFAQARFQVVGFDRDRARVRALQRGRSYVPDVLSRDVAALIRQGRFRPTDQPACLRQARVVLICVPTPLGRPKQPNLSFLRSAITMVATSLKASADRPALVVLESTTYPGTTDEFMQGVFRQHGHQPDLDVFLAFSPERIDPSNPRFPVRAIPKLVGGTTPAATRVATAFYRQAMRRVVPVSSSRVAETAKLLENSFRSINIALANEFALLCHRMQVDVWEVIRAASTKPFGFMPFYPGPGVGGHCIPSDPIYLTWRFGELGGVRKRLLIETAADINARMPKHVVNRIQKCLTKHRGRGLRGAAILLLGVAYKPNVNDTRDAPALQMFQQLRRAGARVTYHDPHVPVLSLAGRPQRSVPLTRTRLTQADCVVIVTNHRRMDYRAVGRHARMVFDTRNVMRGVRPRPPILETL